tara:strand:- start:786 stop:1034 length:249 start_codon:yes stop_codon:yes gene_type:complete
MIDLDKLIQWALVAFSAGTLVLITHLLTIQMAFHKFEELSADIHEQTTWQQAENAFPLPRLNGADSLAYCINMVDEMKAGTR